MTTEAMTTNTTNKTSSGLNIGLWIAQVLGGFAFAGAGAMKLFTPVQELAVKMAWVKSFPVPFVKFIALAELLGGLGLILPSALKIKPVLTPVAAAGLVFVMLGAIGTHIALGEAALAGPSIFLSLIAAFVAWGRGIRAPITDSRK